jgi:uncharacterized protein YqeY
MAALKDRIQSDLKDAMKARDQVRLDTLRSAISGFSYRRVEAGRDLTDSEELEVVRKAVKQRTDSIEEYTKGDRPELADKEKHERDILVAYLPAQLSADDVRARVKAILAEIPAENRSQGAVMKVAMPQLKDYADGNLVRAIVTEELASA